MRLWVTRTEPGAAATAAALRAQGHAPLVAPLLVARPLDLGPSDPRLAYGGAIAFTSAQGVAAFAALSARRDAPVFAVGDATARMARAAGFADVRSADGDGPALARLIAAAAPVEGVLVPGAQVPAFDLPAALAGAGVAALPLPVYAAVAVEAWPPAVRQALGDGGLDGVLLHSAAAARALAALVQREPADGVPGRAARALRAFGLSPACVAPLEGVLDAAPVAAAAPRERDLLSRLPPA